MPHTPLFVLCHQCTSFNRLPAERLAEQPRCGKCQHSLTPITPVELNDLQFPLITQKAQQLVVADFWASWCGPCKSMAPVFAQVAAQIPAIHFVKVDVDHAPQAASQFQIRSVPSLVLLKNGREVDRLAGAIPATQLSQWLNQHLSRQGS